MEEAEEAEPDEEFKDAIEVGGPSPAPSTDQARGWVILNKVVGVFVCFVLILLHPNGKPKRGLSWVELTGGKGTIVHPINTFPTSLSHWYHQWFKLAGM